MKVFICWSGPTSGLVAESLRDWLRKVIQAVEPFISEDIEKGEAWMTRLTEELAQTKFAIICLTQDNLTSPWLHFETGAIWKGLDDARVVPYLHGVDPADLKQPLAHFQSARATRQGTLDLLNSINAQLESRLSEAELQDSFELRWPMLEKKLAGIEPPSDGVPASPTRSAEDVQREILLAIRDLSRSTESAEGFGRATARLTVHRSGEQEGGMPRKWEELTDSFNAVSDDGTQYQLHEFTTMQDVTTFDSEGREAMATLKSYRTSEGLHCNVVDDQTFEIVALGLRVRRLTGASG